MASIVTNRNGTRMIQFALADGERKYVRLGKLSMKQAETVRTFIEDLVSCRVSGTSPRNATAEWAAGLPDRFRARLERVALVAPRRGVEVPTVAAWVRSYIEGRGDVKPNTRRNFEQAFKSAAAFFGDRRLDEITPGDADAFRVRLKTAGLSEGTIRRRCKRVRQFFAAAVKRRIIAENPFAGMKCGTFANAERFYYVTGAEARAVLDACPDAEWRLLFALCRYAGLRCPTEVLALTWADVDWERMRFTVHASKTEHLDGGGIRVVPIFPELRPYLQEAFDQAEPGQVYAITRYRDANANLRTQLCRIIRRAGLTPWAKLFQNLRSTRETELCERFPLHVVCKWLGNTTTIASKHYLQVTDEHFRQAAEQAQEKAQQKAQHSDAKAQQKAQQQAAALSRTVSQNGWEDARNTEGNGELCEAVQSDAGRCDSTGPLADTPKGTRTP